MSAWDPPNTGARNDSRGYPIPSQFDAGKLPEGSPPLFKIIGSQDAWTGQSFLVRDGASGAQLGFSGPQPPEE